MAAKWLNRIWEMCGGSGYGKWGVELFWVGVGIVEVVMEGVGLGNRWG